MTDKSEKDFFSRFYDEHVEALYRFVYFKVSSKEISEDLTAEAFTRLWEQMKSPTEIKNPRAYLYQVTRNLVIDHYRQQEPTRIPPEEVAIAGEGKNPEEKAALSLETKRVGRALSRLRHNYQNVLLLYYVEKMPAKEIAEREGKSENAVRVTIHRALKALRRALEKER